MEKEITEHDFLLTINGYMSGGGMLAKQMFELAKEYHRQHSANPTVMGHCVLCKKDLHHPIIAGYCSKECAEIALNKEAIHYGKDKIRFPETGNVYAEDMS